MDATKPAGRLASPLTEVLGLTPERAAFEAWAAKRWGREAYRHTSDTSGEWDAWQAARVDLAAALQWYADGMHFDKASPDAFASKLLETPGSGWRLAAVAAMLTGCSQMTQPSDIEVAQELCGQRGGFTHVSRFEHGQNLLINCKDGTYIDVRLAKKA